jgi:hypothetical protein
MVVPGKNSGNPKETCSFKNSEKRDLASGFYSPTMRSIAPTRMPNIDVDAESMPRRM